MDDAIGERATVEPEASPITDWPDLLALDIRHGRVRRLAEWAASKGIAVEAISRGFARL